MSKSVNIGDVYCFPKGFYRASPISATDIWVQISETECMTLHRKFGGVVKQNAGNIPDECIVLFNFYSLIKDHIVPKL